MNWHRVNVVNLKGSLLLVVVICKDRGVKSVVMVQ